MICRSQSAISLPVCPVADTQVSGEVWTVSTSERSYPHITVSDFATRCSILPRSPRLPGRVGREFLQNEPNNGLSFNVCVTQKTIDSEAAFGPNLRRREAGGFQPARIVVRPQSVPLENWAKRSLLEETVYRQPSLPSQRGRAAGLVFAGWFSCRFRPDHSRQVHGRSARIRLCGVWERRRSGTGGSELQWPGLPRPIAGSQ